MDPITFFCIGTEPMTTNNLVPCTLEAVKTRPGVIDLLLYIRGIP